MEISLNVPIFYIEKRSLKNNKYIIYDVLCVILLILYL